MATDLTSKESSSFSITSTQSDSHETEVDSHREADDAFELFRDWIHSKSFPKRTRISFIQGVLEAEMSPERLFDHNLVKMAVGYALQAICEAEQLGRLFGDRSLFINTKLKVATEPDLMFIRWSTLREKRVECRPYKNTCQGQDKNTRKGQVEVHGIPDVIVEVVSNSSVKKDKILLKESYFATGVPEYWLIDARDGRLEFTIFEPSELGYVPLPIDQEGFRFSKVFNRSFFLERYVDPVSEDAYRLLSKKTPL